MAEAGPSIATYEPAEVGLSQAALDRLLPYSQSIVDGNRVPNGSESDHHRRVPRSNSAVLPRAAGTPPPVVSPVLSCSLTKDHLRAAKWGRSDTGLAPRQDRPLRGHGTPERRHEGVAHRRAQTAAPRHHLSHLLHVEAHHLRRPDDAVRAQPDGSVPRHVVLPTSNARCRRRCC